jgi:hypothetical protein
MKNRSWLVRGCFAVLPLSVSGCGSYSPQESADDRTALAPADCSAAVAGAGFVNVAIGYQGNAFAVEFDATPDAAAVDAVIGFADGPADAFSDLAAAVRFNPDGFIDARDGDVYRVFSGAPLAYQPGSSYHFSLDFQISRGTYSARVNGPDGSFSWLAADAAFRSSQQGVLQLTHRASIVDSAAGGVSVCNYREVYADRCTRNDAGGGWDNRPSWPSVGTAFFSALAKPTQSNLDVVIGVSNGPADAFADLAAILRFNPAGQVDARNGSAYAAVTPFAYRAGGLYTVNLYLDLRQHRYDATIDGVPIAQGYAFRTEQSNAAALDHDTSFVDSPSGGVILCNGRLVSTDRSLYTVASQGGSLAIGSNGRLYEMSDGVTVRDAATGAPLSGAPFKGRGRTDSDGNLILAGTFDQTYDPGSGPLTSSGSTDVFVAKYTPDLVPVWGRALGTPGVDAFADLAVDGQGRITIVGSGIGTVVLDQAGTTLGQSQDFASDVAANAQGELALAGAQQGEIWVEKRDPGGQTSWRASYPVTEVSSVALSDSGDVFISGRFHGIVTFGGAELRWTTQSSEAPSSTGYLVKLSPNGQHVWSLQNDYHAQLADLVVDPAGNVTFAATEGNQVLYATAIKYAGADGRVLYRQSVEPDRSTTLGLAADGSGAIYWSLTKDNYGQGTRELLLQKLAP